MVKKTASGAKGVRSGRHVAVSRAKAKEFYKQLISIQEGEKKRISRDLHDETGQIVVALGSSLSVVEKELKAGNVEKSLAVIFETRKLIQEIAQKIKSMAVTLRPPAFDILGLSAVLREYFSQCTKSNPVKISFNENVKDVKLAEDVEIGLYRIVQEAIYNTIKHARATSVNVSLIMKNGKLELAVEDNGVGFDYESLKKSGDLTRIGLTGIMERVSYLGGAFSINSVIGKGTTLKIVLPIKG